MEHIILRNITGRKYILLGTVVKYKETIVLVGDLETGELFEAPYRYLTLDEKLMR